MGRFDSTCWSVVLRAAEGQERDREEFARRYEAVVRSYLAARWRIPAHTVDVADATQEVMIECLRPGGVLERVEPAREGGFRAYLYGVTRRIAIGFERKRRRDSGGSLAIATNSIERDPVTLSAAFDKSWARMVCREAMHRTEARLRGDQRVIDVWRCLKLRYVEGRPPREIAMATKLTVEQVYEALKRAKDHFRESLIDVLAEYSPGTSRADLEARCRELAAGVG